MEEGKNNITFNIYGGNNQILPNATKAVQNFYGDLFARDALRQGAPIAAPLTDQERRLLVFVEEEESLRGYVAQLAVCKTAAEVGEVVIMMYENEPKLTEERIVKTKFIENLLPLIPNVKQGLSIDNLRVQINNALLNRKEIIKR